MQSGIRIRFARESDIPQLTAISEAADSAAHWTAQQWLDIFRSQMPARLAWVAEDEALQQTVGFLIAQNSCPEWELENVAVLPEFRRRGVGRLLLSALLDRARSTLAERIILEVRASNHAAVCLYNLSGFQELARRRNYYRNPEEDALILVHAF
jgi:ribosomal-protein-alanine N-acetyltransferase